MTKQLQQKKVLFKLDTDDYKPDLFQCSFVKLVGLAKVNEMIWITNNDNQQTI